MSDSHLLQSININSERDILVARKQIRDICQQMGFGLTDVTRIVTSVSELARNIQRYADQGTVSWRKLAEGKRTGIELLFEDSGPGIENLDAAMQNGFSTTNKSMGMGLPGVKRLMDEMEAVSTVGIGTKITIRKWRK